LLTVIIPTRNSPLVGKVIEEVLAPVLNSRNVYQPKVLVAGYNSPEKTRTDTELLGGKFIKVLEKGKTAGLQEAVAYVDTPYCAMLDADTTYPAKYLRTALRELQMGADVVIGWRCWREQGSMTQLNELGNWGLSTLASVLYGRYVRDVCTGMWAFRTDVLRGFKLTSYGFQLEADLFVNAVRRGCRIVQIPIEYRKKPEYKKGVGLKEGLLIGQFLVKSRFSRNGK
jgi:dolichol-phosphate mannosyltransferase